jgi:hypothetical protein
MDGSESLARRHRCAVGDAFAKHADTRFSDSVSRHSAFRRHTDFGRKRNHEPFELIGAPYIDPDAYADRLNALGLPGVFFRSCVFQPTFQKHAALVWRRADSRNSIETCSSRGLRASQWLSSHMTCTRTSFAGRKPPYEYVYDKNPFDVISGTAKIREAFEKGTELDAISKQL